MAMRLGLSVEPLVSLFSRNSFLVEFTNMEERNRARALPPPFILARDSLVFVPWCRRIGGVDVELFYKVRLCIEGVPRHGWQLETVTPLFERSVLVEGFIDWHKREAETACICIWAWTSNPDTIAKVGILKLEEPLVDDESWPPVHYPELGIEASPPRRSGSAKMLAYEVLIHLDEVIDYSPVSEDEGNNGDSDSSDSGEPWPPRYTFPWSLGAIDQHV
ncbi:hypothetical protein QOZ80_7BG0591730 [Eleusine coracana subsp. coracana]|nr:hypothetical protein QOZ80_7BG0591730 [Eleusine coracana subsp. coracana]